MLALNFNPFPALETERLILREITLADAEDYFIQRSDKETMKFIDKPLHKSVSETEELIIKILENAKANECIAWAISLKENPKLIGTIGYHRISKEHHRGEVGYMIGKEYWNKGIVSEALEKVLDFGFTTLNFHSIEGVINPNNIVSGKLLKKFGFIKEAYFKENYFYEGKYLDTEIYSLLKKPTSPAGKSFMKQQLIHIALVVKDYDEAIKFYTEKLNFTLVEDTVLSETKRWVIVKPQGSECSLLLAKAANERQTGSIGNQTGGRVFLFLNTDDFWRDYNKMKTDKINFIRPPSEETYGTVAVFEDLYGNLWDLVQLKK